MSQEREAGEPRAATPPWPRRLRQLVWILAIFLAVFGPIVGRVAWEGRAELARADELEEFGTFDERVIHLGRAARWRLPGSSHDERAIARLMELAAEQDALSEDGRDNALTAYREARRALVGTRALGVSDPETLDLANQRIAALMAAQEHRFEMDLSGTGEQEAYHLALLRQIPGVDPTRGWLAALAFVLWAAASVGFVMRGLDAHGHLRVRTATRWGGASVVLLMAWVWLMGPL